MLRRGARALAVACCAAYVLWVLASVVAWVSHLGARLPALGPFLAGGGAPNLSRAEASLLRLARANIPAALGFVLPHSLLRPARLARFVGVQWARLCYNTAAAASLHIFLAAFVPHTSPILVTLPLMPGLHATLSTTALTLAFFALVAEPRTWGLLGVPQALGVPPSQIPMPPARMDVITWQGICVHSRFGPLGLFAFSGISIIPRDVTLSDVFVRFVAAAYLRVFSRAFRSWVSTVESTHLIIWAVRASLVLVAVTSTDSVVRGRTTEVMVGAGTGAAVGTHLPAGLGTGLTALPLLFAWGTGLAALLRSLERAHASKTR
jgi:hypothetical protein